MHDPDGVNGLPIQKAVVTTRPQPKPYVGGNVYHTYPPDWTGAKLTPNFTGLLGTYYTSQATIDANKSGSCRVKPGDTIIVHAGHYGPGTPYQYENAPATSPNNTGMPFENTMYLTCKGTADKPIAIVAAGDGPAIFDGGNATTFPFQGPSHIFFDVRAAD